MHPKLCIFRLSLSDSYSCILNDFELQIAIGYEFSLVTIVLRFSLSSLFALSWSLSTQSSPQSSRTMLSQWSICAATSGPFRAWTTARSSSQQSKTPGCPTWLLVAADHTGQRLLKVGIRRVKLVHVLYFMSVYHVNIPESFEVKFKVLYNSPKVCST